MYNIRFIHILTYENASLAIIKNPEKSTITFLATEAEIIRFKMFYKVSEDGWLKSSNLTGQIP